MCSPMSELKMMDRKRDLCHLNMMSLIYDVLTFKSVHNNKNTQTMKEKKNCCDKTQYTNCIYNTP